MRQLLMLMVMLGSKTHSCDQFDRIRRVSVVIDCARDSACIVSLEVDIPGAVYHIHGLQICGLKG